MSLIADALKAAQDEKRKKLVPPRVQSAQTGYFPLRGAGRDRQLSPTAFLATGAVVLVAALAAMLVVRGRGAGESVVPPFNEARGGAILEPQIDSAAGSSEPFGAPPPSSPPAAGVDEVERRSPAVAVSPPPPPPPRQSTRRPTTEVAADASARPLVSDRSGTTTAATALPTGLQITMDRSAGSGSAAVFQQALAAQRRREFVTARNLYLQAVQLDPGNAEAHNNLGAVYRALNDPRAAEAAYRTALDVDARYAQAWSNLGALLGSQGRAREAIDALQQATRLDPENAGAKVNLAIQYHAAGLLTEAKRLLEEVLRADPTLAQAHYSLGQVFEAQSNTSGAIASYRLFLSTGAGQFPQLEEQVRRHLRALEAAR